MPTRLFIYLPLCGQLMCWMACSATMPAGDEPATTEQVVLPDTTDSLDDVAELQVVVAGFEDGQPLPDSYAFCVPAEQGHVKLGPNTNPAISWSQGPAATASYLLLLTDPDVPGLGNNANKEGLSLPVDLPRVRFYHWVLADIPTHLTAIGEGASSSEVTARGKPLGPTAFGLRGYNDYTIWFGGDEQMEGDYGGYDGPCPPWNDERVHRYIFSVFALDVPKLPLAIRFGGAQALAAAKGHVLAKGSYSGTFSLNPSLRPEPQ